MRPQTWHIILLIIVIILVFGSKRLPDVARGLGQSLKIFKNEVKDLNKDDDATDDLSTNQRSADGTVNRDSSDSSTQDPNQK